jgi:hypothetical protein
MSFDYNQLVSLGATYGMPILKALVRRSASEGRQEFVDTLFNLLV